MAFSFTSQVKPGQRRAGEGQEQEGKAEGRRAGQGRAGQGLEPFFGPCPPTEVGGLGLEFRV